MSTLIGMPLLDGVPATTFREMTPLGDPDHGLCASSQPAKTGGRDSHVQVFSGLAITFFSSVDTTTGTPGAFVATAMNGTVGATVPAGEPSHNLQVRGTLVDDGSIPPIVVGYPGGLFGGANIHVDFDYTTFNDAGSADIRIGTVGSSFGVTTGVGTTSGHFSLSGGDYGITSRAALFLPGAVWWKYTTSGVAGVPSTHSITISNFTITVTYGTTTRRPCLDGAAGARESFFFGRDAGGAPWTLPPAPALITAVDLSAALAHEATNSATARGFLRAPAGTKVNGPTVTVPNASNGTPLDGQLTLGGAIAYSIPDGINPVTGAAFTVAELSTYQWGVEVVTLTGTCHLYTADLTVTWSPRPPDVAIVSPLNGATVSGVITVTCSATAYMAGMDLVELIANGVDLVGDDNSPPYAFVWDTTPYDGTDVELQAFAVDLLGNLGLSAPVTVHVTNAPPVTITITPPTLRDAHAGLAYSQLLTASGGTGPYTFTVVSGTLPTGITLTSGGLLAGTPPVTTATIAPTTLPDGLVDALYSQTLSVTDLPGTTAFFTVRATDALVHTGDQAYALLVTDWVGPTTFAVIAGACPKCISLRASGLLTGTPVQVGAATFTVQATNAAGATITRIYTLTSAS